jgi:hypothetical protein
MNIPQGQDFVGLGPMKSSTRALARQKQLQLTGFFTAQLLYKHSLKSSFEDYK